MIELSAGLVWAHQGGCCMVPLSSDLQIRVVGLLAQLALNMVVACPQNQSEREKACHADPATYPQNPS